jgi:thymidylate kinase
MTEVIESPAEVLQEPVTPMLAGVRHGSTVDAARSALLRSVFSALDHLQIPYCVTHGYQTLPEMIESDVDMIVHPADLPKIHAALTHLPNDARLVQWIADGACWAAVAAPGEPGRPAIVQLHFSPAFELNERVFYPASEILSTRRRCGEFWIPKPPVEFACICINRAIKQSFKPAHIKQLSALLEQDPAGCTGELLRFFDQSAAHELIRRLQAGDAAPVPALSLPLPKAPADLNSLATRLARATAKWARRFSRWIHPRNGLHIVFLGPDGVGKSTVIDAVRDAVLPAFLRTDYMTFAPSLIPGPLQPTKESPHQLPPRSFAGSMLKVAWWSLCYTAGYFASVRPAAARSSLILNHRYLLDALVDPKRYRYSGPKFPVRLIWFVAPKPDVIILLDAPAEVIQARKREVPAAETARQRSEYRQLIAGIDYAHVIDTHRPLPVVAQEVIDIFFKLMADRSRPTREGR